jgi:RNA polymerase sigma-70 factor (ECF subfamily)
MVQQPRNRRQWSDSALVSAIAARDGAAFAVFYRRHLPAVLAFLLRETRDPEAAADLAAEVFAAVLLSAGRYAEQGQSATPWVIGITRNKLRMSFRRGRVEARARHRLGFQAIAVDDGDLDRIEQVAFGAGGQLVSMVDERPHQEIAGELRCSELVIRKRVSRGLARMREQLRDSTPPARSA